MCAIAITIFFLSPRKSKTMRGVPQAREALDRLRRMLKGISRCAAQTSADGKIIKQKAPSRPPILLIWLALACGRDNAGRQFALFGTQRQARLRNRRCAGYRPRHCARARAKRCESRDR